MRPTPDGGEDERRLIGESSLRFTRWFLKSKFALMQAFLGELEMPAQARDPSHDRRRFLLAMRHAERALVGRVVVSVLLVFGIVATAAAAVARVLYVPAALTPGVEATLVALDRVAAVSGSLTVLLLALRLAFDRYLERVETTAVFIAMQLASAPREP